MTTQAVYELAAFSESERRTLRLIAEYLSNKKGRRDCFVYKYLRMYYERRGWENVVEWHTVERNIRRLAEHGWLVRRVYAKHRGGRAVVFCLSEGLEHLLAKLGWLKLR
ncbi:hypothetical protein Pyrde_2042 [Pyrodictium delaneyi]|uniref:Uncharacterized protein n=1 Tax=Pyrodictium delaneyi TaxID=1273541 RepID=A0A0P0N5M0_9CREN|nr:hypothetical protein [Pyrodictium delaneyi]ALL02085.1 hypothetical protein Pyrde_2042 [Pyrodictium delaneyi]